MNLRYLGDALDHWKGSIFEILQSEGFLNNLRVDAMASDTELWKTTDTELFARLLRVQPAQIIQHRCDIRKERSRYFKEIPRAGDIFLDPDTGIRTGGVKYPEHYVTPEELSQALKQDEERLIIVYQHVRAQRTRQRVENVLAVLRRQPTSFSCASYESATVALLFFGIGPVRVQNVRDCFVKFLGIHASNRVGYWET